MHLVSDEIYALSIFAGHEDAFVSTRSVASSIKDSTLISLIPTYVHTLYGMSKDFCLNGMRVGLVHTSNSALLLSLKAKAIFALTSAHTQRIVGDFLSNQKIVHSFLSTNQRRLAEAYAQVVAKLRDGGVQDIQESRACLFVYCNLFSCSHYRGPKTRLAERGLWLGVLKSAKILIFPGSVLHDPRVGWFRLCFTANPLHITLSAIDKILEFVAQYHTINSSL